MICFPFCHKIKSVLQEPKRNHCFQLLSKHTLVGCRVEQTTTLVDQVSYLTELVRHGAEAF